MVDFLHEDMIRKAVAAAKAGDRETALGNLREVLEENSKHTHAWLLLARLSPDVEEKVMALETVLAYDPENKKALALLAKIKAKIKTSPEVIPGISQRDMKIAGGVIATVVVFILLLVILVSMRNSSNDKKRQQNVIDQNATQERLVQVMTEDVQTQAANVVFATETQKARVTPTPLPTNTLNVATLPPSYTPRPEVVETGPEILPPPEGITGIISGWSGIDMLNVDALPLVIYRLNGEAVYSTPQTIGSDNGRHGFISSSGQQMAFTRFIRNNSRLDVTIIDMSGEFVLSNLDAAPELGGYFEAYMPAFSTDGSMVTFIGESTISRKNEVYLVLLYDPQHEVPTILTSDGANYSYPSFSPDGTKVVAVRENPDNADNPGPDLVIIDVRSNTFNALTTDNAETLETMPRWSPDGSLIAYAASNPATPNEHDIFVIPPESRGTGVLAIDDPEDAIYPVYSPDGQQLAFSSNRNGNYEIYIFDLVSHDMSQLTNSPRDEDYPANWIAFPDNTSEATAESTG